MHANAVVGKGMGFDGGTVFVHHKTPTHLYVTDMYQMDLPPEHQKTLTDLAKTEPATRQSIDFKYARHESRPWDIVRKKASVYGITHVPGKEEVDNWGYTENDEFKNAASKIGYNAVLQNERKSRNLAVFHPSQIKSATHNDGSFSPNTEEIDK